MTGRVPFTPVREDQRPYWQVVYDEVVQRIDNGTLAIGDIVPFGEFQSLLGEGIEWRGPVLKAAKQLRETRQRSLDNVRGVGYKLIAGSDHVKQAKRVKRRAGRELERARQHYLTVDRGFLSLDQSTKLDLALNATALLVGFAKETDERLAQVEDNLATLQNAQHRSSVVEKATADELADLRREMDELKKQRI